MFEREACAGYDDSDATILCHMIKDRTEYWPFLGAIWTCEGSHISLACSLSFIYHIKEGISIGVKGRAQHAQGSERAHKVSSTSDSILLSASEISNVNGSSVFWRKGRI